MHLFEHGRGVRPEFGDGPNIDRGAQQRHDGAGVTRIYIDEAGTNSPEWLAIGVLVVPDHKALHNSLVEVKRAQGYFNTSPTKKNVLRETHLAGFRRKSDLAVAEEWIKQFMAHGCYYRCIVVDWGIWDGRHFGDPFDPDALKKRRAYKKWLEMLLHPEVKKHRGADLYLDKLRICHGYEVLGEIQKRFTEQYAGGSPWIRSFQYADSSRDAHQCLQLCDLITGCVYQSLVPSGNEYKLGARRSLYKALESAGVKSAEPSYWRGYHKSSLEAHFAKFSEWFWSPSQMGGARGHAKRTQDRHAK